MASPVTFSGIGSGIDIETLVSGLVGASRGPLTNATSRVSSAQAAVSTLSGIGTLLKDLKSVVDSLDTATELAGYKGTSTNEKAVRVNTTGEARPGNYRVKVNNLLQEQRTYGASQAGASVPLGMSGTLKFTQGGNPYEVAVGAGDTLTDLASRINAAGADITASVFQEGGTAKLMLRGTEAGAAGAFSIVQDGFDLGLTAPGANVQEAKDASVNIDGFTVTSASNTVTGAIPGVTLELLAGSDTEFQVGVVADSSGMKTALADFVTKYNAVVERIHSVAGFGDSKGTSEELRGDSALRSVTQGLSDRMLSTITTGGNLSTLADLGIRLNNNGTIKLDSAKMEKSLAADPASFQKVLAGSDSQSGVMDIMRDMLKGFTDVGSGLMDARKQALDSRIKLFKDQAAREQARLDQMEVRLRKTFSAMDATVGGYKDQLNYLYQWSAT